MGKRILVTGAGGCVGIHLVKELAKRGHWIRGIDKRVAHEASSVADEFMVADLTRYEDCLAATYDIDQIFHLAADSGGVQYRTTQTALPVRNNTILNLNVLEAARAHRVGRVLFASSTAVYPAPLHSSAHAYPITEEDALLANPQDNVGWEKLFAEQVCRYYAKDFGLDIRCARLQGIFGPHIPFDGGKEMALAALCRDIARAQDGDTVVVWGDGKQTRSYLHVEDCVSALVAVMEAEQSAPVNVGSEELISINDLVTEIAAIAGKSIVKRHDPSQLQGVRRRRIDTSRLRDSLGWTQKVSFRDGLTQTYEWIEQQIHGVSAEKLAVRVPPRKKPVRVRAISRPAPASVSHALAAAKKSA